MRTVKIARTRKIHARAQNFLCQSRLLCWVHNLRKYQRNPFNRKKVMSRNNFVQHPPYDLYFDFPCDSIFLPPKVTYFITCTNSQNRSYRDLDTSDICMMKDADDIFQPDILVRQDAQRQSWPSKEEFWE